MRHPISSLQLWVAALLMLLAAAALGSGAASTPAHTSAAAPPQECTCGADGAFRVLAIGDSLTVGTIDPVSPTPIQPHPYTLQLAKLL